MRLIRLLPLLALTLLAACTDDRASFEIKDRNHALTLIRVTQWPWDKVAQFDIVALRMPDCMRRHPVASAPLDSVVEIYSPGNDAWVIKLDGRMFVTESRTCEGFAPLNAPPEGGIGPLMGRFEMNGDKLVFVAAPKAPTPPPAPVAEAPAVVQPAETPSAAPPAAQQPEPAASPTSAGYR